MPNRWMVSILSTIALMAFAGASAKPGTVTGRATDAAGKPIAGAKVWVKPVVTTGLHETRTDANGRYEATGLPPVGYRVLAWAEREYNGQRYCIRLGHEKPEDYTPLNPAQGAVRNFVLKSSGRIEDIEAYSDMGYFGGSVSVMSELNVPARKAPIEFTLTPTGPLLDGSQGKTLTLKPNAEGYLLDVPVGVYKVRAVLVEGSKRTPVKLGLLPSALGSEATLEFKPSGQPCVGSTASGIARAYLYWGGGAANTGKANSDGTVSVNVARTSGKDGMAGTWQGTLSIKGGQTFLVRLELSNTEYGEGYVLIGGDFLECESEAECTRIGSISGKRVPGALVNFTTTLEENGASFQTVGHFEGSTFVGLTDAVFQGQEAVLKLSPR